jgi:two-component system response regulator FixJ
MGGLELQHVLGRVNSRLPVVVLTALGGEELRARTLAAGAVAFLAKPFDEHALLDAVAAALRRRAGSERGAGRLS